jgi:glutamate/tyrosine decarboxylase-like PLP-dependent enzyme
MANFVCFLAARDAQCPTDARKAGVQPPGRVRVYSSVETHTWVKKAANFFGLGTDAIRWVPADEKQRMDVTKLDSLVREDLERGNVPLMVIGTAGSVATGAVDPLRAIGDICAKYKLWFHIDGAYGGFAAILDDPVPELRNLALGDSLAIDPHKWLYAPVEAGCALVRDPSALRAAFSYRPDYYRFGGDADDQALNYFEYGPQNSRGFRALKVWLALRQIGREGYRTMIGDDCRLAEELYREVEKYRELEAVTQGLSITTFRYVPPDLRDSTGEESDYLNSLNEEILTRIQNGGHAYVSNAVVGGKFVLRACIVNFRTTGREVRELPKLVVECGIAADTEIRARVRPVAR